MKYIKKHWMIIIILLLLLGATKVFFFAKEPAAYLTDHVKRQDLEVTILADGKMEASQQVDVGAQVSGQIKKLHVALGDAVTKDQLIAEIDDLPQQNALKDSEARLKNVLASKAAKEAQIVNAKITMRRQETLIKQKATTQADVDVAESNLRVLEAELSALEAQIAQAQIALDSARLDLTYTKILAPIDGIVVATVVKEGQTVNAVQTAPTIVKVANLSLMTIKAQISEADITKVKPGMAAYFTILGEPRKRYPAQLKQLEPAPEAFQNSQGNTATTTSEAIYYNGLFNVENPDHLFRVDMTTQVYIVVNGVKDQLVISSMATRFTPSDARLIPEEMLKKDEAFVWLLQDGETLVPRKVTLGISNNIFTEVLSGLEGNETIVISEKIESGAAPQNMRMPRRR